jgi:hypothetical protein
MMGANMGYGYQPGPRDSILKKYAYFPKKTSSNKWVWFDEFYEIRTHYDENGKPPIKTLYWKSVLNKKEYLIWLIKNPKKNAVLPSGKSALYYYKK